MFRAAVKGGRVVGTAGAAAYGAELAWVCMVLVDPAEQGRGLGTRLLSDVLERLAGFAAVGLDATPQGRPVYERLGFVAGPGLLRLEREPAPSPGPSGAVRPMSAADLAGVLAWDRDVFGADRSRVLAHARATASEYAFCAGAPGALEGYCFGRRGWNAEQIGPVVARTTEAAARLVSAVLARHPDRRFYIDVTTRPAWRAEVERLGFREQRPFTRMGRGAPPAVPQALHAIFGPEFG